MLQKVPDSQPSPDGIEPLEPTLADVLAAIERDPSLPVRNAWRCSIRRIAKFLERDLARLPARLGALRYGIARLHHAQLGVSRKTLQNHVANLKAAVRHFAGLKRLSGRGIAFTPSWQELYDQLAAPPSLGTAQPAASTPLRFPTRPSKPLFATPARSSSPSSLAISTSKSPAAGIGPRSAFPAGPRSS